jgi:hypothetical protein
MVIAFRTLKLTSSSATRAVRIDIFQPEKEDGAWRCRYMIEWPDKPWESSASGQDSIQALICALQKIGFELYASEANKSGQLRWDNWQGFGFPVPQNARDVLTGDDARFL